MKQTLRGAQGGPLDFAEGSRATHLMGPLFSAVPILLWLQLEP